MGELEKKEAKKRKRKKTRSLIENEYFKKKCENEKREDSLWPREKNERKVEKQSNCERVSEVKSILFSKQNIFDLIYKRTCFLTGELNPCFSIASFEFLQEAKTIIKMLDLKVAYKINNVISHMCNTPNSKVFLF